MFRVNNKDTGMTVVKDVLYKVVYLYSRGKGWLCMRLKRVYAFESSVMSWFINVFDPYLATTHFIFSFGNSI